MTQPEPHAPSAAPARGAALGSCDRPLAEAYDAGLYDLDGVLYLGPEAIPHAAHTVRDATARGLRPAFVTNNASRSPATVAEHLTRLGIPARPSDVVTSAQAAARWLAEHLAPGAAVLVVGTADLAAEVRAVGLRVVTSADEQPAAVVQGLSQTTGWAELAEAAVAIRRGALWVAGNTDTTLPSTRGPLPGNGAFVAALVAATGSTPIVVGKPEPALHRESVQRVGARHPLVIGDRLDTDVLGAVRGDCDSLLVLTGVVDLEGLLAASTGSRPTFVGQDLRALLAPQPAVLVETAERTAACGEATAAWRGPELVVRMGDRPERVCAELDGDRLRVTGPAAAARHDAGAWPDVALRAVCALAWHRADAPRRAQH